MTVMFEDIHIKTNPKMYTASRTRGAIDGLNFTEILYADDTLLVVKDAKSASLLLQEIEKESQYYNMKLNEDKCETIAMGGKATVKFGNGKTMRNVEHATYLGGTLHRNVNPQVEIRKIISATIPIVRKLDLFWTKANCPAKWKLNVYNAVIISKLVYGLETLQFTETQGKQLDTFQQRGLRKILGIAPTYIDRSHTNKDVIELANKEKGADTDPTKTKIIPLTETIKNKKNTLLGHVIRAGHRNAQDPLFITTFEDQDLNPKTSNHRRVGGPRLKWHSETMTAAWSELPADITRETIYTGLPEQRRKIRQAAIDRTKPFQRTKNELNKMRSDNREKREVLRQSAVDGAYETL